MERPKTQFTPEKITEAINQLRRPEEIKEFYGRFYNDQNTTFLPYLQITTRSTKILIQLKTKEGRDNIINQKLADLLQDFDQPNRQRWVAVLPFLEKLLRK